MIFYNSESIDKRVDRLPFPYNLGMILFIIGATVSLAGLLALLLPLRQELELLKEIIRILAWSAAIGGILLSSCSIQGYNALNGRRDAVFAQMASQVIRRHGSVLMIINSSIHEERVRRSLEKSIRSWGIQVVDAKPLGITKSDQLTEKLLPQIKYVITAQLQDVRYGNDESYYDVTSVLITLTDRKEGIVSGVQENLSSINNAIGKLLGAVKLDVRTTSKPLV